MSIESFDHMIDKPHRGTASGDLAAQPVDSLKGVSAADGQHLSDAFGIETISDLAGNRFVAAARAIHEDAANLDHDRGPDTVWTALFAAAPLGVYQAHPNSFRLDFGPVYYRGRLDGTARVLIVGQDPAANELVGHRIFVGTSGQRIQGFLRRIGIRRDYVMINTFVYSVRGTFVGDLTQLTQDPDILGYRNQLLDRIAQSAPLEAIIAVGAAGNDAVNRWPGSAGAHVRHITHPSAHDHAPLLANWNAGLADLRAVVDPEAAAPPDPTGYGADWVDADHEPIPRRDLPFNVPEWHGVGSTATRARTPSGSTDHKRIIWKAP